MKKENITLFIGVRPIDLIVSVIVIIIISIALMASFPIQASGETITNINGMVFQDVEIHTNSDGIIYHGSNGTAGLIRFYELSTNDLARFHVSADQVGNSVIRSENYRKGIAQYELNQERLRQEDYERKRQEWLAELKRIHDEMLTNNPAIANGANGNGSGSGSGQANNPLPSSYTLPASRPGGLRTTVFVPSGKRFGHQ